MCLVLLDGGSYIQKLLRGSAIVSGDCTRGIFKKQEQKMHRYSSSQFRNRS